MADLIGIVIVTLMAGVFAANALCFLWLVFRFRLCWLGLHPRSRSVSYLGMTIGRRNWLGIRQYKSFLGEYLCPRCGRTYRRWS